MDERGGLYITGVTLPDRAPKGWQEEKNLELVGI